MSKLRFIFCFLMVVVLFGLTSGMAVGSTNPTAGISGLNDPSPQVRRHAAYKLGETRNVTAVPALIESLNDDDMHLRRIAARALGKIGRSEAVMPLIEVLCRQDQHRQVQLAAICALGRIGDPRAGRTLEHMAEHEPGVLGQRAAENLVRLKENVRVSRLVTAN